jgi:hypothetical protein
MPIIQKIKIRMIKIALNKQNLKFQNLDMKAGKNTIMRMMDNIIKIIFIIIMSI